MKRYFIVRSIKSQAKYVIFLKRKDALNFLSKHPDFYLE